MILDAYLLYNSLTQEKKVGHLVWKRILNLIQKTNELHVHYTH